MSAPSVPCTLLTPIAPQSLSFRPLVIPESSELEIYLPVNSRSLARYAFSVLTSLAPYTLLRTESNVWLEWKVDGKQTGRDRGHRSSACLFLLLARSKEHFSLICSTMTESNLQNCTFT